LIKLKWTVGVSRSMEEAVSMKRPEPRFSMKSKLNRRPKTVRGGPVVVEASVRGNPERLAEEIAESDREGDTALAGKGLSMGRIVKRRNTTESLSHPAHN